MIRGLLLFGLSALLSEAAFAQSGQWNLKDKAACSAVIIGPAGGTIEITNAGTGVLRNISYIAKGY